MALARRNWTDRTNAWGCHLLTRAHGVTAPLHWTVQRDNRLYPAPVGETGYRRLSCWVSVLGQRVVLPKGLRFSVPGVLFHSSQVRPSAR